MTHLIRATTIAIVIATIACTDPRAAHDDAGAVRPDSGDDLAREVTFCATRCAPRCVYDGAEGTGYACDGDAVDDCATRCVARCEDDRRLCLSGNRPMCGSRWPLHCIPANGTRPDAGFVPVDAGRQSCAACMPACPGPYTATCVGAPHCPERCRARCGDPAPLYECSVAGVLCGGGRCVDR